MTKIDRISVPKILKDYSELVAAFYKFTQLKDTKAIKAELSQICISSKIKGTILIASEGINGTVSGPSTGIKKLINWLNNDIRFQEISPKFSFAKKPPFNRLKIRLKKEIVTMGQPNIDPTNVRGEYVKPEDWHTLVTNPDTLLIDVRNNYEISIGSFKNSLNPQTNSFRDFPNWVKDHLANLPHNKRPKNIAMFCTGGIRCEKASSYLVSNGFKNVFHLEGGILKYLENIPKEKSIWEGECFVFDQRVSVLHGLKPGNNFMCYACRMPITLDDLQSSKYEIGVSCPHCYNSKTQSKIDGFRQRQKQIDLAKKYGKKHIG